MSCDKCTNETGIHKFEPRYDMNCSKAYEEAVKEAGKWNDPHDSAKFLEAATKFLKDNDYKRYVYDICVNCGKTVKPDN